MGIVMNKINLKIKDKEDKEQDMVIITPVYYAGTFCPVEDFCSIFNLEEDNKCQQQ